MSWVQQQPPPSQAPQPTTSSTLLSGSTRQHVSSSVGLPTTTSSTLNTSTKPQPNNLAHSNNNQPTHQLWQQQNPSMMQPPPNPPSSYNATPMNKWPQQQHNNAGNTNMFQPIAANNWTQSDLLATALPQQQPPAPQQQQQPQHQQQQDSQATNYASYFTQAPQLDNNYMHQQYQKVPAFSNYQPHPQSAQQPTTQQQPLQAAMQQPIHPPVHQALPVQQAPSTHQVPATHLTPLTQQQQEPHTQNYIDNNNVKNDGWSDWDWNDNSNINNTSSVAEQQTQAQLEQQLLPAQMELQQQTQYNVNFIEDSFRTENNDNWQWGSTDSNTKSIEQKQQHLPAIATVEVSPLLPAAATPPTQFHQPQVPTAVAQSSTQHQHFADLSIATAKSASHPLAATAASAEFNLSANINSLPPRNEIINDNLHNSFAVSTPASSATTTSNIPNSVYVSQAKPVAKPSRQYASPPIASPTELRELSALSPPHAFQNEANSEPAIAPTPITAQFVAPSAPIAATPSDAVLPPPAMTPPAPLAPPVGNINAATGNPFKRSGAPQHHRGAFIASHTNNTQPLTPISAMNFVVPPPPADFATPMQPITAENVEPDNSEILHENQEVIVAAPMEAHTLTLPSAPLPAQTTATHPPPNDERNQYLQTSHLSENPDEEQNIETDNFPPPGLSRLVLGQPEFEASQRMVTGTDQGVGNMNIDERHADGEDTSVEQLLPSLPINTAATVSSSANNIDITTDRNLYLVAGESIARNEQRVVTGVERLSDSAPASQIINEQREIELDGENLEDQQLQQAPPPNTVASRNEPPLEGAVANSIASVTPAAAMPSNPVESSHKQSNTKDHSNISTGNDESDPLHEHQRYASKSTRNRHETNVLDKKLEKQRKEKQRSVDRYATDDTEDEYPSEHERDRRRNYREGSTRSDRGLERDLKDKKNRREMRGDFGGAEREREKHHHHYRAEGGERSEGGSKPERRSQRYHRYEADSKYETEESTRHESTSRKERRGGRNERGERDRVIEERSGRSDRSERDYDDYRRYQHASKREGKRVDVEERRDRRDVYAEDERRRRAAGARRGEKDYRSEYDNTIERRNNRRSDKQRGGAADPLEYEEYRKQSSRNARESDLDKDRRNTRGFDPRHAGMYGGYPSTAYGYDPYTYYYEQMARTNPQAYAEWYKKYYGQAAALHGNDHLLQAGSNAATDGRESVHSGRSSANNENDRFTHAYISQANEYHRHFMHHQQQQQQQQQLASNMSHTMNSTMLEEAAIAGLQSNQNYPLYSLSGGHSTGNLSQIHATTTAAAASYYAGGGGGMAANMDYAYYARSEYADSRSGNLSLRETAEPQRLTPCKFVNDHAVVSFSAGLLITVKPKYTPNGVSNIVKLLRLGANDSTRQLFQAFPGPLVRGLTHKKTIIEFCEEQIHLGPTSSTTIYAKQLLSSNVEKFKASYTLMWNLLILLLRQNGMVVGTDIAELLLKNQVQFPYMPQSNTPNSTASNSIKTRSKSESDSNEDVDLKDSDIECDAAEPVALKSAVTSTEESAHNGDDSVASLSKSNTAVSSCSSEEEITAKFRNFLLYGNVNEALDWATDNNLWGHALFLASKVDRRSHANVMMKFANKLSLNDPLQTLYQLMSGRTPSSVTSVQDEKWGDWRPHLSMILSNTSQKPELDRKAITTLGDSLFHRGDLYAAHFCYLMAQVGFGRYHDSATQETTLQQSLPKLVLLGSSHYKLFKEFATNESIIMTEIYEYACSLNDDKFSLVEFQPYKYLLATHMLDYGYQLKSLMYMEQISMHIERDPGKYEPSFINKVYEFADRLKFYDPVLEKTMDDPQNMEGSFNSAAPNFEEQKWLQILRGIAAQNKPDYGFIASTNTAHVNAADENMQLDYQKQFAEINKQFNELNMQYNSNNNSATEGIPYNTDNLQQQMLPNTDNTDVYAQQQQQQTVMANNVDYVGMQYAQPAQQAYTNETQAQSQDIVADSYAANYGQQYMPTQQQQQSQYYDPNHQQQQQTEFNASSDAQNSGSYDYWGGQQQQQQQHQQLSGNEETSRPTISMPNAKKSYDSDGADDRKQKQEDNTSIPKKNKIEGKDGKGIQSASNQNSGWFGGIWNKLSLKPKNQMILPDDKNPTIVWDAEKKRWVNTDGAEDAGADVLKPPPKMGEMMSQQQPQQQPPPPQQHMPLQQQQQQQQIQNLSATPAPTQFEHNQYGNQLQQQSQQLSGTATSLTNAVVNPIQTYSAIGAVTTPTTNTAEPTKPPSLQSNMFKMQRNRTLKNSYVDVFNPSGAPMSKAAENVLAPALPPASVPQGGFFIPGAPNVSNDAGAYQQEPAQDLPQFYNPNQYGAATGSSY